MGARPPEAGAPGESELAAARARMVTQQLRRRGIADPRVLEAMGRIPRHAFLDPSQWAAAYGDHPLPIGEGQTISQPYIVALMTELCDPRPGDRILEVGAGSGYQTAVLAALAGSVFALELEGLLAARAREALVELGVANARVAHGDGTLGWAEHAPYRAILVAAGAPAVPRALIEQLDEGGHLVIPVGRRDIQVLQRHTKKGAELSCTESTACRFVDLRGEFGWGSG